MAHVDPQHMLMLLSSTAKSGKQVREIRIEVLRRDAITQNFIQNMIRSFSKLKNDADSNTATSTLILNDC